MYVSLYVYTHTLPCVTLSYGLISGVMWFYDGLRCLKSYTGWIVLFPKSFKLQFANGVPLHFKDHAPRYILEHIRGAWSAIGEGRGLLSLYTWAHTRGVVCYRWGAWSAIAIYLSTYEGRGLLSVRGVVCYRYILEHIRGAWSAIGEGRGLLSLYTWAHTRGVVCYRWGAWSAIGESPVEVAWFHTQRKDDGQHYFTVGSLIWPK